MGVHNLTIFPADAFCMLVKARKARGNWLRLTDFSWHEAPRDREEWTLVHTASRDSTLLEKSNAAMIDREMERFSEATCRAQSFGHWAVGHVDGYAIRCLTQKGRPTLAFRTWCALEAALADYPILCEEDYNEREMEASEANIRTIGARFAVKGADWESKVWRYLADHHPDSLESVDDGGAWPSEELVQDALAWWGLLSPQVLENLRYREEEERAAELEALPAIGLAYRAARQEGQGTLAFPT